MKIEKEEFEQLIEQHRGVIERLVYYKIPIKEDAEDILQDIWLLAYEKVNLLREKQLFKAWLIKIATNACYAYYRKVFKSNEVALDKDLEKSYMKDLGSWRVGRSVEENVMEVLEHLKEEQGKVLQLFYYYQLPIAEIAKRLNLPEGTVKSRLSAARKNFRKNYPYFKDEKGDEEMKKNIFPEISPLITIEKVDAPEFEVRCMQDTGYFIRPRVGEHVSVAAYDFTTYPEMKKSREWQITVEGKAKIHGIECIEAKVQFAVHSYNYYFRETEDYIQTLAAWELDEQGFKKLSTFLDDDFWAYWGIGEDNCGEAILRKRRGDIEVKEDGTLYKAQIEPHNYDIVGRYKVTIGQKSYDTIRHIYFNQHDELVENYISKEGKNILFRRFNKYNWQVGKEEGYSKPWTEMFPETDRVILNGEIYVHWYNCLPDYIIDEVVQNSN